MKRNVELPKMFAEAFPVDPLPVRFLRTEAAGSLEDEFVLDLKNRVLGRRWTEVNLMDWRMMGAPPSVTRVYLEPTAFMYYVPSIVLGAYREMDFIDWALEAIIPYNKRHIPRGKWWFEFLSSASPSQRQALSAFLADIRSQTWDEIGPENQYLLDIAESIWSADIEE